MVLTEQNYKDIIKRNCLYCLYQHLNTKTEYWQLIIPLAKREEILRDMHEGTLGGHLGEEKTFCHLRERYYSGQVTIQMFDVSVEHVQAVLQGRRLL